MVSQDETKTYWTTDPPLGQPVVVLATDKAAAIFQIAATLQLPRLPGNLQVVPFVAAGPKK